GEMLQEIDGAVGVVTRHTCRRLVEKQQSWTGSEAKCQFQTALVASGEMLGFVIQPVSEADLPQMLGRFVHDRVARAERLEHAKSELTVAARERGDRHVLDQRQTGKYLRRLKDAGDALLDDRVRGEAFQFFASIEDGTMVSLHEADQDIQKRRFSGAVRTDDGVNRAFLDAQVHVVEGAEAAEVLGDAADLEDFRAWHVGSPRPYSCCSRSIRRRRRSSSAAGAMSGTLCRLARTLWPKVRPRRRPRSAKPPGRKMTIATKMMP